MAGLNKNITLVSGLPLTYTPSELRSYQYQYLDFSKVQMIVTEGLKVDDNGIADDSKKAIRNIMLGKNSIIRMHTIGEHLPESNKATNSPFDKNGDADLMEQKYSTMPCGIHTTAGSIISTPILPNEKSKIVRNGLNNVTSQRQNGGWNWNVVSAGAPLQARVYGYHTKDEYITNLNSKIKNVSGFSDWPVSQTRSYELPNVEGSFIFCYDIGESYAKGEGKNADEQNASPNLHLQVPLDSSTPLNITIPPTGQITAKVKNNTVSGGMSMPQTDFLPIQCNKAAGMPTRPLYIYPTYGGIVITNSINKNMSDGGGEIYVKFSENGAPIQSLEFKHTNPEPDIQNFINSAGQDEQGFIFKWIPAVHQSLSGSRLQLRIKKKKTVKIKGTLRIDWVKCLGNFAYSPLYFNNQLYFDLYFKGSYDDGINYPKYIYQCFPVVCENGTSYSGQNKQIGVSKFYNDKQLKETIYHAAFEYKNDDETRYPIQVFGAVVAATTIGPIFEIANANGTFAFDNLQIDSNICSASDWFGLITNCQISCGLQGPTGSLTIDSYAVKNSMDEKPFNYSVGELDLDVCVGTNEDGSAITQPLFKGIGFQVSKSNNDNNNQYTISLVGMQQKMQDMKLVCAPFWDGDKLEAICLYFQNYLNLPIAMVSHQTTYAKSTGGKFIPNSFNVSSGAESSGTWISSQESLVKTGYKSTQFRVPRSMNWESPAIDFPTSTACLQALKTLAEKTSCFFTVGLDGYGYYYELNMYGIPYYANTTTASKTFQLNELISFSLQPVLNNKYNAVATFGFLQKRFSNGKVDTSQIKGSTMPGSYYTKLSDNEQGNIKIPWARAQVAIEQGFLTKSQLLASHINRLTFSIAGIYQGSITVLGNTDVNHVYQTIQIGSTIFFVTSIEHNIDLSSKVWTTTYSIQKYDPPPNIVKGE